MVWALKSMTKDAMVVKNQVFFFYHFSTGSNEHPKQKTNVRGVFCVLFDLSFAPWFGAGHCIFRYSFGFGDVG